MDALVKASWLRALRSNEYRLCKDDIAMNEPLSFDPYGVLIDLYFKNNSGDHGWVKADSLGILNDILGDKDRLYPLMSKDELPYTEQLVMLFLKKLQNGHVLKQKVFRISTLISKMKSSCIPWKFHLKFRLICIKFSDVYPCQ